MILDNDLVREHMSFIRWEACKFPKHLRQDLIQEGFIGLMRAIQNFNPEKNVKLITYAIYYIRDYMRRYYKKNCQEFCELRETDIIVDVDYINEVYSDHVNEYLAKGMEVLSDRESDIIINRYLADKKTYLHLLGKRHGVSEERARQIECEALLKIRNKLENPGGK